MSPFRITIEGEHADPQTVLKLLSAEALKNWVVLSEVTLTGLTRCWRATGEDDFGRQGTVSWEYLVTDEGKRVLELLEDQSVYMYEAVGKHSNPLVDIGFDFEECMVEGAVLCPIKCVSRRDPVGTLLDQFLEVEDWTYDTVKAALEERE